MKLQRDRRPLGCVLGLLLIFILTPHARGQTAADEPVRSLSPIASLGLTGEKASQLRQAVDARDYPAAEKLLLNEIALDPRSLRAAKLLAFAGRVYFLDQDYLNAAVAWKKSDAIVPLEPSHQFSLAMVYIRLAHPDWAKGILQSLATKDKSNALYPYWLGRLEYDAQHYNEAMAYFRQAIALDSGMARAYDNLGLCYFYQNQNELAVENYEKAIDLDRSSPHPSAWPYLNLAITLQFLNRLDEAEANLRRAIRLEPHFAQAHYQLGRVLEELGRAEDAILELRESARLDPNYAEPHFALARILHKLNREPAAQEELQTYLRLHAKPTPVSIAPAR
jgi:tetratricopeptide (TPR) repeat protein